MDNSPETPTMTRSQILIAMAITAIVLLVVAKAWMYLFAVQIVPLNLTPQNFILGIGIGSGIALLSSLIYEVWPAYRKSADTYLEMVLKPLEIPDLIWLGILPGSLHMVSPKQLPYPIWATVIGFCLGSVTLVTGNLAPAIVAHIFTNSISGLIWKLKQPKGKVNAD
jgi:uncharacterized protein